MRAEQVIVRANPYQDTWKLVQEERLSCTCYNQIGGLLVVQMDGDQRVWPVQRHCDG